MSFLHWLREGITLPSKSQAGLARHLQISRSVVSRMVAGTRPLRGDEIEQIAVYLGVPPPIGRAAFNQGIVMAPVKKVAQEHIWSDTDRPRKPSLIDVPVASAALRVPESAIYAVQIITDDRDDGVVAEFALCVVLASAGRAIKTGDRVHVERQDGPRTQVLIRRAVVQRGSSIRLVALIEDGADELQANATGVSIHGLVWGDIRTYA